MIGERKLSGLSMQRYVHQIHYLQEVYGQATNASNCSAIETSQSKRPKHRIGVPTERMLLHLDHGADGFD